MDTIKLKNILNAGRGTTALINRYRQVHQCTFLQAHNVVLGIWGSTKDKNQKFQEFANLLLVENDSMSKEQFLNLLTAAVDCHKQMQMDPLEAAQAFCNNLVRKGGLDTLSRKMDLFVRSI